MKLIAWLVGGTIFSIIATVVFGLATLHLHLKVGAVSSFLAADVLALLITLTAPTSGKAWRRLLVTSAILCLMMPLAGLVMTGTNLADPAANHGAGTVVVGGAVSVFSGFVGFFLAAVLLIAGLACGRSPARATPA